MYGRGDPAGRPYKTNTREKIMQPFTTLTSHMVAIPTENIDTDQIIPAQFLKTISKKGLGEGRKF